MNSESNKSVSSTPGTASINNLSTNSAAAASTSASSTSTSTSETSTTLGSAASILQVTAQPANSPTSTSSAIVAVSRQTSEAKWITQIRGQLISYINARSSAASANTNATSQIAQEVYPQILEMIMQELADAREQVLILQASRTQQGSLIMDASYRAQPFEDALPLHQTAYATLVDLINDYNKAKESDNLGSFSIKHVFTCLENVRGKMIEYRNVNTAMAAAVSEATKVAKSMFDALYDGVKNLISDDSAPQTMASTPTVIDISLHELFLPVTAIRQKLELLRSPVSPANPNTAWDYIINMAKDYQASNQNALALNTKRNAKLEPDDNYVKVNGKIYSLNEFAGVMHAILRGKDPQIAKQIEALITSGAIAAAESSTAPILNLPDNREREWLKLAITLLNLDYDIKALTEEQRAAIYRKANENLKMRLLEALLPVKISSKISGNPLAITDTWLSQEKGNYPLYLMIGASFREDIVSTAEKCRKAGKNPAEQPNIAKFLDEMPNQLLENIGKENAIELLEQLSALTSNLQSFKLSDNSKIRNYIAAAIPTLIKLTVIRMIFFTLLTYWTTRSTGIIMQDIARQLGEMAKTQSIFGEVAELLAQINKQWLPEFMKDSYETFPKTPWKQEDIQIFFIAYSRMMKRGNETIDPASYYLLPDAIGLAYCNKILTGKSVVLDEYFEAYKNILTNLGKLFETLEATQRQQQQPRVH